MGVLRRRGCALAAATFVASGCSIATSFSGLTGGERTTEGGMSQLEGGSKTDGTTSSMTSDGAGGPSISRLTFTNCATGEDVMNASDGEKVSRASLPSEFSMRAYTIPSVVGSVLFRVDGSDVNLESNPPYDLAGGTDTMPDPWTVSNGPHDVEVVPYADGDASGTEGTHYKIKIIITQ